MEKSWLIIETSIKEGSTKIEIEFTDKKTKKEKWLYKWVLVVF